MSLLGSSRQWEPRQSPSLRPKVTREALGPRGDEHCGPPARWPPPAKPDACPERLRPSPSFSKTCIWQQVQDHSLLAWKTVCFPQQKPFPPRLFADGPGSHPRTRAAHVCVSRLPPPKPPSTQRTAPEHQCGLAEAIKAEINFCTN